MNPIAVYRDRGLVAPQVIAQVEVARNIRFPTLYKEIISKHNALRPQKDLLVEFRARLAHFFLLNIDSHVLNRRVRMMRR